MKIAILDTETVTRGDLDMRPIDALGEVTYHNMLNEDEIIANCADTEVIICNKANITRRIMESCKKLRYVGVFATGYNNIDVAAANDHNITVCNVPGYSTNAVAQHAFAMILQLATSLQQYNNSVHNGSWVNTKQFSYFPFPMIELAGKTLGIFGFGAIGQAVAKMGEAFGMRVIFTSRSKKESKFEQVPLDRLFRESDFLTFHSPLTPETKEIVNKQTLSMMKPTAFFINTARGGIMVEQDVADALNNDIIAGAAIDVLTKEPMVANHPFLTAKNCILTPHVAWAPLETRSRLILMVAENVRAWQNGAPIHQVNA